MSTPTPDVPDFHLPHDVDHHTPSVLHSRRRILTGAVALTGAAYAASGEGA